MTPPVGGDAPGPTRARRLRAWWGRQGTVARICVVAVGAVALYVAVAVALDPPPSPSPSRVAAARATCTRIVTAYRWDALTREALIRNCMLDVLHQPGAVPPDQLLTGSTLSR